MNAKHARYLFDTDSKPSVFRAELCTFPFNNPAYRAVNLYPRKSRQGFVYCIWKHGVAESGLDAIVDGGVARAKSFDRAALEATAALMRHHRQLCTTEKPEPAA